MITNLEKKRKVAKGYGNKIALALDAKFNQKVVHSIGYRVAHKHLVIGLKAYPIFVDKILRLEEAFATACAVDSVRIYRNKDRVCIDIPMPEDKCDIVTPKDVQEGLTMHDLKVPLGMSNSGEIVYFDFSNPVTSHLMASGQTGSGKSTLIKWFIEALTRKNTPDQIKFAFIDLAGGDDFEPFENSVYNLHAGILTEIEQADAVLQYVESEAKRRAKTRETEPAIFVFLDEAQILLGRDDYPKRFARFASTYRKRNMHLVTVTQDPIGKNLGDLGIKKNSAMIAGRMGGARTASNALDLANTGANTLVGNGDFLLIGVRGIERFTGVYLKEADINTETTTQFNVELAEILDKADTGDMPDRSIYAKYHITDKDMDIVRDNHDKVSFKELSRMLAAPGAEYRNFKAVKEMIKLVTG